MESPRQLSPLETATILTLESAIQILAAVRKQLQDARVTPCSQMLIDCANIVHMGLEMDDDLKKQLEPPAGWPPEGTPA
jgi:hypothetical protein